MIKENIREMRNAIKNDDLTFVKNMIESQSVNINEVTSLGSFLHIAARKAKYKIAEYLIDAGIDLELLSEYPTTPPTCARSYARMAFTFAVTATPR